MHCTLRHENEWRCCIYWAFCSIYCLEVNISSSHQLLSTHCLYPTLSKIVWNPTKSTPVHLPSSTVNTISSNALNSCTALSPIPHDKQLASFQNNCASACAISSGDPRSYA